MYVDLLQYNITAGKAEVNHNQIAVTLGSFSLCGTADDMEAVANSILDCVPVARAYDALDPTPQSSAIELTRKEVTA